MRGEENDIKYRGRERGEKDKQRRDTRNKMRRANIKILDNKTMRKPRKLQTNKKNR